MDEQHMDDAAAIHEDVTVTELDEPTCWRLVGRAGFGRVGVVHDGAVLVLPVNVAVADGTVVFRTAAGATLHRLDPGATVAFETDHIDRVAESGWSVLIRGRLWDAGERARNERWHEFLVRPWAPPPRDAWMLIEPTAVTGRMIQRHRHLAPGVRVPYMSPD